MNQVNVNELYEVVQKVLNVGGLRRKSPGSSVAAK